MANLRYVGLNTGNDDLFKSYFFNRNQRVVVSNNSSLLTSTVSGVPKDLFLALFYIQYTPFIEWVKQCKYRVYADNTKLSERATAVHYIKSKLHVLQKDSERLALPLNPYIHFIGSCYFRDELEQIVNITINITSYLLRNFKKLLAC